MSFNQNISFSWNVKTKKATVIILGEEFKLFFKDFACFYKFQQQVELLIKKNKEDLFVYLIDEMKKIQI